MAEKKEDILGSMMNSIDKNKNIVQKSTNVSQQSGKVDEETKATLLSVIQNTKNEGINEIPLLTLKEHTEFPLDLIQVAILELIMEKKLIGFINDQATSDLSDDILIIREKRILDEIEPEFRTG